MYDIIGQNVILRDIDVNDTHNIIKWRNSDVVRKNFIYQKNFTEESHNKWLKDHIETGKSVQKIIYEKHSSIPIGSVYLRDIDKNNRKAEFGIFIGEERFLNKGLGTESTYLICHYGFEVLQLHKIFLRVFKQNVNAIRTYEKSGFIKEADLHDEIYINGEFKDIILMAKFK